MSVKTHVSHAVRRISTTVQEQNHKKIHLCLDFKMKFRRGLNGPWLLIQPAVPICRDPHKKEYTKKHTPASWEVVQRASDETFLRGAVLVQQRSTFVHRLKIENMILMIRSIMTFEKVWSAQARIWSISQKNRYGKMVWHDRNCRALTMDDRCSKLQCKQTTT